jgi:hypothetical protein
MRQPHMDGPNDCVIQGQVLQIRVIGKMMMHIFPNAMLAPACKTLVDAIPIAVLSRQQTLLRSTTGDPQDAFQEGTAIRFQANLGAWVALQVGVDFVPLIFSECCC